MKSKLQPALPILNQLLEGLKLYGLLDVVRSNPIVFRYVFCPNNVFSWTFEKLEECLCPEFSSDGSNLKSKEVDCYKVFMDSLESFFYESMPIQNLY